MLQEIETQFATKIDTETIKLTPTASQAVKDIFAERNLEGYALRVYATAGGCSGVQFDMALDNNFRDIDAIFDIDGVKVVVDNVSMDYLQGASIDFVNDPERGAGFAVKSQNAKSHEHSEGECGCGGSCSCKN